MPDLIARRLPALGGIIAMILLLVAPGQTWAQLLAVVALLSTMGAYLWWRQRRRGHPPS